MLQIRGFADGSRYKAVSNQELTLLEKSAYRQTSRVRSKAERAFGALRRDHGFSRARDLAQAKVELEFFLNAMAYTMTKAVRKAKC